MGAWLAGRGVAIHRGTRIEQIEGDADAARSLLLADGTRMPVDCVIAAVPWRQVRGLLGAALRSAIPSLQGVGQLEPAAITAVHLWYDRPLDAAPARGAGRSPQSMGVRRARPRTIITRRSLVRRMFCRNATTAICWPKSAATWRRSGRRRARPACCSIACSASQRRSSPSRPGLDRFRPRSRPPSENLFLAGDWTATGWPATMEGAVRSGRLAVEALLRSLGKATSPADAGSAAQPVGALVVEVENHLPEKASVLGCHCWLVQQC